MADYQTVEEQKRQMNRNHDKKRRLDSLYEFLTRLALILAAVSLIPAFVFVFMDGVFRHTLMTLFCFLTDLLLFILLFYSFSKRSSRFTLISGIITLAMGFAADGPIEDFLRMFKRFRMEQGTISWDSCMFIARVCFGLQILAFIMSIFWEKLSQEPGFPDFKETYEDYKIENEANERGAYERALASGARTAEPGNSKEKVVMDDLLDAPQPVHYVNNPQRERKLPDASPPDSVSEVQEAYAPHLQRRAASAGEKQPVKTASSSELLPFQAFEKKEKESSVPSDEMEDISETFSGKS